jgi:Immunity protein Imm1
MTYQVTFDICLEKLADTSAVTAFLEQASTMYAVHGQRALTFWFAPADADNALRMDIDYDNDRAALRWLPDGTHAVELDVIGPIVVMESSDYDVVTIPAELARVSVDTAHRAVIEYVTTGQKPTCVRWEPVPAATAA